MSKVLTLYQSKYVSSTYTGPSIILTRLPLNMGATAEPPLANPPGTLYMKSSRKTSAPPFAVGVELHLLAGGGATDVSVGVGV